MTAMHELGPGSGARRGVLERPDTPAQTFAGAAGLFLTTLGVLALIFADVGFGTVDSLAPQPEFLIWTVSGWTTILWIAMGVLGLLAMARLDTARSYSLIAAVVFAAVAVWGFINGSEVARVVAADTTNNVMHAILAGVGLMAGMLPRAAQRAQGPVTRADRTGRFDAGDRVEPLDRRTAGRR
jgi:Domain of unknown function (DUF4383)